MPRPNPPELIGAEGSTNVPDQDFDFAGGKKVEAA
jgi:hypothetical protein